MIDVLIGWFVGTSLSGVADPCLDEPGLSEKQRAKRQWRYERALAARRARFREMKVVATGIVAFFLVAGCVLAKGPEGIALMALGAIVFFGGVWILPWTFGAILEHRARLRSHAKLEHDLVHARIRWRRSRRRGT